MSENQMFIRCIGDVAFLFISPYLDQIYGFPTEEKNALGQPLTVEYCTQEGVRHPDEVAYKDEYFIPVHGNGTLKNLMDNQKIKDNPGIEFWTVDQYIESLPEVEE